MRRERPHGGSARPREQPDAPPGTASSASSAGRRLCGQRARAGREGMTMGLSTQEGRGASGAGPGAEQHAGRSRQGPHRSRDPGVGTQAAEAPRGVQHQAGRPCRPEPLLLQAWEPSAQAGETGEGQLGPQKAHRWTHKQMRTCAPLGRGLCGPRSQEAGLGCGAGEQPEGPSPRARGPWGPRLTPGSQECGSRGHTQGHLAQ